MRTELESSRARSPILKRATAGLVLVLAAVLAVHFVVGLITAVVYFVAVVAVIVAVAWALKTILW